MARTGDMRGALHKAERRISMRNVVIGISVVAAALVALVVWLLGRRNETVWRELA